MDHPQGCGCEKFSLGGEEVWLNSQIDFESLKCFNEAKKGSCKCVLNGSKGLCTSDDEQELIFVVRFDSPVALKSIYFQAEE